MQLARIGRLDKTGKIVEIYQSPQAVMPEPFPPSRSREEWRAFLDGLH